MSFENFGQWTPGNYSPVTNLNTMLSSSPVAPSSSAPADRSFMDILLGGQDDQGTKWGSAGQLGLNVAGTLMNGYMGWQQLKMARDQLAESKRQFNMNWDAQARLTNSRLEDRQRARLSANPNGYESVASYMGKYGIPNNA